MVTFLSFRKEMPFLELSTGGIIRIFMDLQTPVTCVL